MIHYLRIHRAICALLNTDHWPIPIPHPLPSKALSLFPRVHSLLWFILPSLYPPFLLLFLLLPIFLLLMFHRWVNHMIFLLYGIWELGGSVGEERDKERRGSQKGEWSMRLWTLRNKLRASEGRWVGEWDRLVIRRACIAWCTGCYMQLMNHRTLHQKPGMYCMVTNII